jgi:guanylate kinase
MKTQALKHPFFVIIGPSGSGKTKVAEAVFPKEYKVISHTTRPQRVNEKQGIDYYFETQEHFDQLIRSKALAEFDTYNGYNYGVGIDELIMKTTAHPAYDVLTIQGFQAIEQLFKSLVIPIFLEVSKENMLARLQERGEAPTIIEERSALYEQEARNKELIKHYPTHFIVDANQPFSSVVKDVKEIVNNTLKNHFS